MFYLIHGDDEFTSREQLKTLRHKDTFGYNQDFYNGAEGDWKQVTITINTLPFLSDQRLVVIDGLPKKKRSSDAATTSKGSTTAGPETASGEASKGSKQEKVRRAAKLALLPVPLSKKELAEQVATMQETTVLAVLVEEALEASNPLVKAAEQYGKVDPAYFAQRCGAGKLNDETRTVASGVNIAPEAQKAPRQNLLAIICDCWQMNLTSWQPMWVRAQPFRLMMSGNYLRRCRKRVFLT